MAAIAPALAQKWSYPGCPDVTAADFRKVSLVDKAADPTLNEPVKMALGADGRIYIAERLGMLKVWDPGTKKISVLANLDVFADFEQGLIGVALDPGFASNHRLYLQYAPAASPVFRLSRFTLAGDKLDIASEKTLLEIPVQRKVCCHTGGSMMFDDDGDLWMSVGDNLSITEGYVKESNPDADDQGHAANSNDLRGKILRIHPLADPVQGRYYSIPKGNLFPEGTAKARGEIYTMGHRNPYTLWVDKRDKVLTWGDIGPDDRNADGTRPQTEELNLVREPGFMGWPYFVGAPGSPLYAYRLAKDPSKPMNLSPNNTGMQELPPAKGALLPYPGSAAVTGPIYRYDPSLASAVKLPPHFDGKWFTSDFNLGWIKVVSLDAQGKTVAANQQLWKDLVRPLQLELGPEGALYILEYAGWFGSSPDTRISRLEFTGACKPVGLAAEGFAPGRKPAMARMLRMGGMAAKVAWPAGMRRAEAYDTHGNRVWSGEAPSGGGEVALPAGLGEGVFGIRFID